MIISNNKAKGYEQTLGAIGAYQTWSKVPTLGGSG